MNINQLDPTAVPFQVEQARIRALNMSNRLIWTWNPVCFSTFLGLLRKLEGDKVMQHGYEHCQGIKGAMITPPSPRRQWLALLCPRPFSLPPGWWFQNQWLTQVVSGKGHARPVEHSMMVSAPDFFQPSTALNFLLFLGQPLFCVSGWGNKSARTWQDTGGIQWSRTDLEIYGFQWEIFRIQLMEVR